MVEQPNVILDLCGGTGAWSRPWRDAGYDVQVITLPAYNVFKTYMAADWIMFIGNGGGAKPAIISYHTIYGILAAPPCTEFSLAKTSQPRDFAKGMQTVAACLRIIWVAREHHKLAFWALENPKGLLRQFLGKPAYTFEQWQFGGNQTKATDIWGYFTPPPPTVRKRPKLDTITYPNGRKNARCWSKVDYPAEYEGYMSQFNYTDKRASARAITPSGFAEAFYKANKRRG